MMNSETVKSDEKGEDRLPSRAVVNVLSLIRQAFVWTVRAVLLPAIFFAVFVPIGLIMRAFGKGQACQVWDRSVDSYRHVSKERDSKHMDKSY
jgi:hypothetical protein